MALVLILLAATNAYAASPLECDLLKQNILALNQNINNPRPNKCDMEYMVCMQSTGDGFSCEMSRSGCQSGSMLGNALGSAMGYQNDRQRLQEMINAHNQNCQ